MTAARDHCHIIRWLLALPSFGQSFRSATRRSKTQFWRDFCWYNKGQTNRWSSRSGVASPHIFEVLVHLMWSNGNLVVNDLRIMLITIGDFFFGWLHLDMKLFFHLVFVFQWVDLSFFLWRSPCLPSPFLNPSPETRRDGQFEPQGGWRQILVWMIFVDEHLQDFVEECRNDLLRLGMAWWVWLQPGRGDGR